MNRHYTNSDAVIIMLAVAAIIVAVIWLVKVLVDSGAI